MGERVLMRVTTGVGAEAFADLAACFFMVFLACGARPL
jgi:hypothetical protein